MDTTRTHATTPQIKPWDLVTIEGWKVRVENIGTEWVRLNDGWAPIDYSRSLFDREVRSGKIVAA
jgi:hypothetical protein